MIRYNGTVDFYRVTSTGYANKKISVETACVDALFLSNIGFTHGSSQDAINSDALVYPDPEDDFILDNMNKMQGLFVLAPFCDVSDEDNWYKVTSVVINRHHLLDNSIDNIECQLKKTRRPVNVS
jgi:hypothetical protein